MTVRAVNWVAVLVLMVCPLALSACSSVQSARVPAKQVSSAGKSKTKPDPVTERRIVMLHPKSGERLDLVYFRNGKYDPKAMDAIDRLMRDRTANAIGKIDPELVDFLVDIRTRLCLPPNLVFEILSGYRSPDSNHKLSKQIKGVAKDSLHIHGWAVDFRVSSVNGKAMAEIAKTMQRGGVSFYPSDNHVHVDLGNIRTWPTAKK
ncbi:MAG: DUF882 domain-containing protein, partial [Alphaproteobacteria bacterium]|nr:DUF882 domain-containing protein [Alphaproteobacteria bacterium]